MKIDAVPGRTTTMSLTPTKTGSFQTDPNLRVQCAELCGIAHARMRIPVRVVSEREFENWVAETRAAGPSDPAGDLADAQRLTIVGENISFDTDELTVEGDETVIVSFDNRDGGVLHNWAFYESEVAADSGAAPIAGSPLETGPLVQEIVFDAPESGTYFYRCDVHPTTMTGSLVVQ